MVRPTVDQLKAHAFKLAKILTTYKVKLSSQQCLDVLARLHWDQPYEAVLARSDVNEGLDQGFAEDKELDSLAQWLGCAGSFCDLVQTLDQEGVNQAAWTGHKVPGNGLHWDGKKYLRAAGVTADSFSRIAEAYVRSQRSTVHARALTFSVEAAEPIVDGQLAILRIQRLPNVKEKEPAHFKGLDLRQEHGGDFLYGSEARLCLTTDRLETEVDGAASHMLAPGVLLTYRVSGQDALGAFATVLEWGSLQEIWKAHGPFEVETRILLTRDNSQDSIENDWSTEDDPDGSRLMKFCKEASDLSEEETCDWPPYLEIFVHLDGTCTEADLQRAFVALCAHAHCIEGGGMGWPEMMENFKNSHPKAYDEMLLREAVIQGQRRG